MLRPITFLLLLCPFFVVYAEGQTLSSSSCPCTLRGTVLDSVTGQPVRSALVKARSSVSTWSMLSDAEGKFQFESVPAGKISLTARKPGYESIENVGAGRFPKITFDFDQNASVPVIKLTPLGVIYGHVGNEQGEPLEGLIVEVMVRNPSNRSLRRSIPIAHTDDLGNYRIANLLGGRSYYLIVRQDPNANEPSQVPEIGSCYPPVFYPGVSDFSPATPLKVLSGQSVRADFTLKPEAKIRLSGTVLSPHPLAEVSVSLTGLSAGNEHSTIQVDRSTGAFTSDWIPPGSYELYGSSVEQRTQQESQYLIGRLEINARTSVTGLRLALLPTAQLLVNIRGVPDSREEGLRLIAQIFLTSKKRDLPNVYPARSRESPNGKFLSNQMQIDAVPPGIYAVRTFIPTNSSYYIDSISSGTTDLLRNDLVVDASGSVPIIEVSLREGAARLSGKLTSAPSSGTAYVILWNPAVPGDPATVETDTNGSFAFSSLRPATYKLVAVDADQKLDLTDTDSLQKLAAGAREIALASAQSATADLELTAVPQ